MSELLKEMMVGEHGLVVCDTVEGLFSVKVHSKHLKTGSVMEMKKIRGVVGRRIMKECGASDDMPHIFCRSRQE